MTEPVFIPVILAGGSGERFWPLSRQNKPKQFLTLDGTGRSLIQATVDRLVPLSDADQVYIVTGNAHRGLILEQLPNLPLENLIVEPCARDTAAAILLAALRLREKYGEDAVMGVFPSDHRIGDEFGFHEAVCTAIEAAHKHERIVTLGIQPTHAATGYGYIEVSHVFEEYENLNSYQVKRFLEKPDAINAERLLQTKRCYWNAGMFVFKISTILEAFEAHVPEMLALLEPVANASRANLQAVFEHVNKISIDYAIMEREKDILVIPVDFDWDDLGDWTALERLLKTSNPNVAVGKHLGLDTNGGIMYTTTGDDLIVTIGLEDVVIVRNENVTLVVRKDRTQDIKTVVRQLKANPELEHYA